MCAGPARLAGTVNTALFMTSGLRAALANEAAICRRTLTRTSLGAARPLGIGVFVVKDFEYACGFAAGADID